MSNGRPGIWPDYAKVIGGDGMSARLRELLAMPDARAELARARELARMRFAHHVGRRPRVRRDSLIRLTAPTTALNRIC